MSDPIKNLADRIAGRVSETLTGQSDNADKQDIKIVLNDDEKRVLAVVQRDFIDEYLTNNAGADRAAAVAAFSTAFNEHLDDSLTENLNRNVNITFPIPDMTPPSPGLDPDERDQILQKQVRERGSLTAFEVLEVDETNKTNLTIRTARDLYKENPGYFAQTPINGVIVRSGDQLRRRINEVGENLDPAVRADLVPMLDKHYKTIRSELYITPAGDRNHRSLDEIQSHAIEGVRRRSMAEVAEHLYNHENRQVVFEKIFGGLAINEEIGPLAQAITSDNPRPAILSGQNTDYNLRTEIENTIIDMSNTFGPTGVDALIAGVLNNPELLDMPYKQAIAQLNPSLTGREGSIARGYIDENISFDRITEDFDHPDENATLGSLLGHVIARDKEVEPDVPVVDTEIIAQRRIDMLDMLETPIPELDILVEADVPLEQENERRVGVYTKAYQHVLSSDGLGPQSTNSTVNWRGSGVETTLPLGDGTINIQAGFLQGSTDMRYCVDVLDPFEELVFSNSLVPYSYGNGTVVMAADNDLNRATMGMPDESLYTLDAFGNPYIAVGGGDGLFTHSGDERAADLTLTYTADNGNQLTAGGAYNPGKLARAELGLQGQTKNGNLFFGFNANYHQLRVNTEGEFKPGETSMVFTLLRGVPAGIDPDTGKPVFAPEVEERIEQYDRVELIPRTQDLEYLEVKLRRPGIEAVDPYVVPNVKLIQDMGIKPKTEYVPVQTETFETQGILPKEVFVEVGEPKYNVQGVIRKVWEAEQTEMVQAKDLYVRQKFWFCQWGPIPLNPLPNQIPNPNDDPDVDGDEYIEIPVNSDDYWVPAQSDDEFDTFDHNDHVGDTGQQLQWYDTPAGYQNIAYHSANELYWHEITNLLPYAPGEQRRYNNTMPPEFVQWRPVIDENGEPVLVTVAQASDPNSPYYIPPEHREIVMVDDPNAGQWVTVVDADGNPVVITPQQAQDEGIPESEWEYATLPGGPFTEADLIAMGIPESEWGDPVEYTGTGEFIPLDEALANGTDFVPGSEQWQVVPGDPLTPEQAEQQGIPQSEWMYGGVLPGGPFTRQELEDMGIAEEHWGDPILSEITYVPRAEAEGNDDYIIVQGEPSQWVEDPDGELLTWDEAEQLGMPESERDWVPIFDANGDPVLITEAEADAANIPQSVRISITGPDPDGVAVLLTEGVEYDETQTIDWRVRDPAEYFLNAEDAQTFWQDTYGMQPPNVNWVVIPDGHPDAGFMTIAEFEALDAPDSVREWVIGEGGELITRDQADALGVPYDPTDIIVQTEPVLDSEGLQLYDVIVTENEFVNTQSHLQYSMVGVESTMDNVDAFDFVRTFDIGAHLNARVGRNTTLSANLQYMKTWHPDVNVSGTTTRTSSYFNSFNPFDTAPTDDEVVLSVDDILLDGVFGNDATGYIPGSGAVVTPETVLTQEFSETFPWSATVEGMATRASLAVNASHFVPRMNTTFTLGGNLANWQTERTTTRYLDGVETSKTVDQDSGLAGAVNVGVTKTFNDGALEGVTAYANYQTNIVGNKDAAAQQSFNAGVSIPLGRDHEADSKKLLMTMELDADGPVQPGVDAAKAEQETLSKKEQRQKARQERRDARTEKRKERRQGFKSNQDGLSGDGYEPSSSNTNTVQPGWRH